MLYERHLYLALAVVVAACVFGLARRSLPASLAALVGAPFVTIVLFETPQLTANTLGALLLVAGAALGAVAVLGGSRLVRPGRGGRSSGSRASPTRPSC